MDDTPNLKLPIILPQQAQKHVTHNEALRGLDCIVQLSVVDRNLSTPPSSPAEGDRYIVAAGAAAAWSGHAGHIAAWQGAWVFYPPSEGWIAWVQDEDSLLAWDGADWIVAGGGGVNPAAMVGINAIADLVNRLSVKSDAVLLSHDDVTPGSGDMRAILNKAATGNTASFLFQAGFSGRAEVGLTGDDKLHVKTSPDGSTWTEAMVIDAANGWIGVGTTAPEGPLHSLRTGNNVFWERIDNSTTGPGFVLRKARGTPTSKTAVLAGDVVSSFSGFGWDGSAYVSAGNLRWVVDGTVATSSIPSRIEFFTFAPGVGQTAKLEVKPNGTTRPVTDNAYTLGDGTNRWSTVYAATGTINTSDARDKDVVGDLAFAGGLVDAIDPVLFKWKVGGQYLERDGEEEDPDEPGQMRPRIVVRTKPGVRSHAGWRAQDIKAAMDAAGVDFAAWGLDDLSDPESRQWTRPDQLVAVLWAALKETRAEVATLRALREANK